MSKAGSPLEKVRGCLPDRWDPNVRRCLLMLLLAVGFGTAGFSVIEGWSVWQSLFFTLVTLTTVGYGDYGLSEQGQRFTAVLMIGGIATVSYTVGQILQYVIAHSTQPERKAMQQIKQLRDHFIVCGMGRTGERVVHRLDDAGDIVVVIEQDGDTIDAAREHGVLIMKGDATDDRALIEAGIEQARGIAAVTPSDSTNAMICLSARALAPDISIIARAEDEASICKLKRAGADRVVSPTSYGGDGIAESLIRPEVARLLPGLDEGKTDVDFFEFEVSEANGVAGRTLRALGEAHPRLIFVALHQADGTTRLKPAATHVLSVGEVLVIAGAQDDMNAIRTLRFAA